MSVIRYRIRHKMHSLIMAGVFAVTTATAGVIAPVLSTQAVAATVAPDGFKSVGYMPSWAGDVRAVEYDKLTHINYAFVMPSADGTLPEVPNPSKLWSLVELGHANHVKILISIGGWNDGDDSAFESLAADPKTRDAFVAATVALVERYSLDGADIDWEYPNPGASAENYTQLMDQLGTALHSRGKLLTAAVVSGGPTAHGVQPAVFADVDFLNIMLYDGGSPHANYNWAINNVNEWKARGLPPGKAVLGVPFYSRPSYYSFAQLVAMDPANADRDCTTVQGTEQCYNGRQTVERKTQWAVANAGGIMNWELSQDRSRDSLVGLIHRTATGARSGETTGSTGQCVDVQWAHTANGTPIQLYSCNHTAAQWWNRGDDGTFRALGKCMDVAGGSTANGAQVQLWDCNYTGAQVWQPQSNGTLRNPQSGKCLDATAWSSANGTRLQIWECHAGGNQLWQVP